MKKSELTQLIRESYKQVLKEETLKSIFDEIKNDASLGSKERRDQITEILELFKSAKMKDLPELQIKLQSLITNPSYTKIAAEVFSVMTKIDPRSLAELEKLKVKLHKLIDDNEYDNKNKNRHFMDAVKTAFSNLTDKEVDMLYNAEMKLWQLLKIAK